MKCFRFFAILTGIILIACFGGGWRCGGGSATEAIQEAARRQMDLIRFEARTPAGIRVRGESLATAEELAAIDAGWELIDRKSDRYNYPRLPRDQYTVWLVPAITDFDSAGNYAPSFAAPINCRPGIADPYCGSEYDKGIYTVGGKQVHKWVRYVWAAEQVLPNSNNAILVARARQFNAEYVAMAVSYGGEHEIFRRHDTAKFLETQTHLTGGHPLLPLADGR